MTAAKDGIGIKDGLGIPQCEQLWTPLSAKLSAFFLDFMEPKSQEKLCPCHHGSSKDNFSGYSYFYIKHTAWISDNNSTR